MFVIIFVKPAITALYDYEVIIKKSSWLIPDFSEFQTSLRDSQDLIV